MEETFESMEPEDMEEKAQAEVRDHIKQIILSSTCTVCSAEKAEMKSWK